MQTPTQVFPSGASGNPFAADLERVTTGDRKFFEANPGREYRLRFSTKAEIWEIGHFGGQFTPDIACVLTAVRQLTPGVRVRRYVPMLELPPGPLVDAPEEIIAKLYRAYAPESAP